MELFFILALCVSAYSLPFEPRSFNKGSLTASLGNDPSGTPATSQGWTSSPNGRGTLDIIWSCFLTVFLCGWTTICANVPPLGATRIGNFRRKLLVFFEALAGPEFIFHTALGQYISARQSVKEFTDAGFEGWTTKHGFFADMGGFVLHPPDFVPFPVTVRQLHYLVKHGHLDFSDVLLTDSEIEDKNKFDTLTRLITVLQLFWFVIDVLARASLGMAITTLELSTIGFIFCTLFTYFCWRHKPQDVSCPIIIRPKIPLADILVQAGPVAARPYSYTPLEFARRKAHWFEHMWRYCFEHQFWRYCFDLFHFPRFIGWHPVERPITKIWDDQFYDITPGANALLLFVQFGFASIHCVAWHFHFPSDGERLMWRICSIYVVCAMACTWALMYWTFRAWPWIVRRLDGRQATNPSLLSRLYWRWRSSMPRRWLKWAFKAICNNSTYGDPDEKVPLFTGVIFLPLAALYVCARMYIILEDIINLRDLPTSAYESVDWSSFLPHF
ncbi:hypothetical protein CONLIGDRAFT_706922 [Coniochaeta ligniaria NRRL 30616]|uniref:Wax synthase domain-containing protein n=1 Tax=Coniochaeta ligniaria NRRL 30616 TaxID=1408157 RepID=A0A1J7JG51_9PEZI|nr:hypothetical protein CONLIGDRAFT_706922 [Coniochaeta ligniaria NRRL 30616]